MARTGRHNATGRSTGRPLASQKHWKIDGQFAARLIEMLQSPAMRALSLSGRRFLDRLDIELARHGGNENGQLPLTYSDLERFGLDRHAIPPAIRETVALGFVEVTEQGRAGNAGFRSPSKYRLTYRHTNAAPPTNEWRRLETFEQAFNVAKQARAASGGKQRSSGGKHSMSVGNTHTNISIPPVRETPTT
jgi:hypothetical protein